MKILNNFVVICRVKNNTQQISVAEAMRTRAGAPGTGNKAYLRDVDVIYAVKGAADAAL